MRSPKESATQRAEVYNLLDSHVPEETDSTVPKIHLRLHFSGVQSSLPERLWGWPHSTLQVPKKHVYQQRGFSFLQSWSSLSSRPIALCWECTWWCGRNTGVFMKLRCRPRKNCYLEAHLWGALTPQSRDWDLPTLDVWERPGSLVVVVWWLAFCLFGFFSFLVFC